MTAEDDRRDEGYFVIGELVGPFVELAKPFVLVLPLLIAVAGGIAGFAMCPEIGSEGAPTWLTSVFATCAQVIATLFVALALEARWIALSRMTAALTVGYVAVGVVTAAFGTSRHLPPEAYKWMLAGAVGGGVGGLSSATLVAYRAIRQQIDDEAQRKRTKLFGKRT